MLNAAQLVTLEAELKNDPEGLGYAPFIAVNDYLNLVACLNFVRDGATPFPNNGIVGPSGTITGATDASPIVITSSAHGRTTGDSVVISGVGGNTAANGTFTVTVTGANTFSLNGSTGNAAYTSGGAWDWCVTGVRQATVTTQQILGQIAISDIATLPATQLAVVSGLLNDGSIALTNPDGSDNNNAALVKSLVNAGSTSAKAIKALETRNGSRAEQLFSLSGNPAGVVVVNADVQAALASGTA